MLGRAVSSSTPRDFQPSSVSGVGICPVTNRYVMAAPLDIGCNAVGMQRAFDSAIGLPSRVVSASWMLGFLTPAEVRRSFIGPSWGWRTAALSSAGQTVRPAGINRSVLSPQVKVAEEAYFGTVMDDLHVVVHDQSCHRRVGVLRR